MSDERILLMNQLPAAVICNNFIQGYPSNYEEYLNDFVNKSKLVKDYGNEPFILRKHNEQSCGQNDIANSSYEMDFKLFVDTKYMEARSMLSDSLVELSRGVTARCNSKVSGEMRVWNVIKCFRGKTEEEIKRIYSGEVKLPEGKTIISVIDKMQMNKNILFFIPYNIAWKDSMNEKNSIVQIVKLISNDISGALIYRKHLINKDTYVSFICDKFFVLAKEENGTLALYDIVDTRCSKLFWLLYEAGQL